MAKTAMDATIFIDANAYLYFYQAPSTKQLLRSLLAQKEYVFVTQQIANEVNRNKLEVAATYLNEQLKNAKPSFKIPERLFDEDVQQKLRKDAKAVGQFYEALQQATLQALDKISWSEDEVSKALSGLFEGAAKQSSKEMKLAHERKMLGNPPGKANDPLGDQLSWEQLLAYVKGKSRLWIITRDSDHFTKQDGKLFLNPILRSELGRIQVFVFENLTDGISDFAKATGEGKSELPPPEKLDEIKKEEDHSSLIPLFVENDDRFARRLDPRSRFAERLDPRYRFNRFGDREGSSWILTRLAKNPTFVSALQPPDDPVEEKPEETK